MFTWHCRAQTDSVHALHVQLFLEAGRVALHCTRMATASNSFAYNAEDLAELERFHDAREILEFHIEKFKVEIEDERDTDRVIYGFGDKCPLPLAEGVSLCKSFKDDVVAQEHDQRADGR